MKKIFLVLAMISASIVVNAQDTRVATLTHGSSVTAFYGQSAFVNAHEAATEGDIITLSSGVFSAPTIEKAVTIRGVGMKADEANGIKPTVITGSMYIQLPESATKQLSIEGLKFSDQLWFNSTVYKAFFSKCDFSFTANGNTLKDCTFLNCNLNPDINGDSNASFIGCWIWVYSSLYNSLFQNCLIQGNMAYLIDDTFTNCVFLDEGYSLHSSNAAYNCVAAYIGVTESYFDFDDLADASGNRTCAAENFFKSIDQFENGNYDLGDGELKDAAKTEYLGNDGTEVGMYGGTFPFTPIVSIPRITKCDVSNKTTADGKLSVNIVVTAP